MVKLRCLKFLQLDEARLARAMDRIDQHEATGCHNVTKCKVLAGLYDEAARCADLAGRNAQ